MCAPTREYVFQAYVRTRHLTTDEGIRFHLFDPESSARLVVLTEQLTGTNDWTLLEKQFKATAGMGLVVVQLCRVPSLKFDNKVAGLG
jgi:hypothetical protein